MRFVAAVALVAALAACSPPAQKAAAPDSAAPAAAPAAEVAGKIRPGQWRTTLTFIDMSAPGMPAGIAEKMKAHPTVTADCATADDINEFIGKRSAGEEEGACRPSEVHAAGGRYDAKGTCSGDSATRTYTMSGTYSDSRVEMDVSMTGETPKGPMSSKMHMVAERIGDCPAK